MTCVDCGAKGLKRWQVAPAPDKGKDAFRCGPCSVAHNLRTAAEKGTS